MIQETTTLVTAPRGDASLMMVVWLMFCGLSAQSAWAQRVNPSAPVANGQATSSTGKASPTDVQAFALEEVIVTARRKDESLQKVPIAITTIDQATLQRQGVTTLTDLQQLIPSAYVTGYAHGSSQQFFSLRGQSESGLNTGGGAGGGAAVVGYLSEVPVPMSGPGLYYDLQSVQVLKGPQGTLFGRNTTGGAAF